LYGSLIRLLLVADICSSIVFILGLMTVFALSVMIMKRGKGDHKHVAGVEYPYIFSSLKTIFTDFIADRDAALQKQGVKS